MPSSPCPLFLRWLHAGIRLSTFMHTVYLRISPAHMYRSPRLEQLINFYKRTNEHL